MIGIQLPKVPKEGIYLLVALLVVAAVYFGYKKLKDDGAQRRAAANPDGPAGLAKRIYAAGHSGAFGWSEDEEALMSLANKVSDLEAVRKEYKLLYSNELLDDLQKWLSGWQYENWLELAKK